MFTKLNKLKQYVPASKVGRWLMSFIPGFILAIPLDIFYMAIARPYISQGSSNPFPTTDLWLKGSSAFSVPGFSICNLHQFTAKKVGERCVFI